MTREQAAGEPPRSAECLRSEEPLRYWEDLVDSPPSRCGPIVITSTALHAVLEQTGECHPVHTDVDFAISVGHRGVLVPGALVHSATSGCDYRCRGPLAVTGLRSMSWDFVRPVYPDTPFWCVTTVVATQALDDGAGLVDTVRKVQDAASHTLAVGRMNMVVRRRSS